MFRSCKCVSTGKIDTSRHQNRQHPRNSTLPAGGGGGGGGGRGEEGRERKKGKDDWAKCWWSDDKVGLLFWAVFLSRLKPINTQRAGSKVSRLAWAELFPFSRPGIRASSTRTLRRNQLEARELCCPKKKKKKMEK